MITFHKFLTLRTKFILLYVLAIIIPLLIIGEIVLEISGRQIVKQATENAAEASRQATKNIGELLKRNTYACDRFCFDETLKDYLNPSRIYRSDMESIEAYNLYLLPITYYDFALKYDATSLKIFYLNKSLLPGYNFYIRADEDIQKSPVFNNAVEAGTFMTWGIMGNNNIYLSRAIRGLGNQLYGVTSIEIPESSIYSMIRESNKKDKTIIIADELGNVISSNNRSLISKSISSKPYFKEVISKKEGIMDFQEDGKYKVIFDRISKEVNLPGWYVIYEIPLDNLLKDEKEVKKAILVIGFIFLIFSCIAFFYFLDRITSRIKTLVHNMQKVEGGTFVMIDEDGTRDEIGIMTTNFNLMVKGLDQLINENYVANLQLKDIKLKKREAELYALQSQINPHFLFNTLESVRMKLINADNREISEMILCLSKILRKSLNWHGEMVSISEEIDFVKNYLDIHKYRFNNRISYEISIPETLLTKKIPKLIIQPIVENAIKHGIVNKRRNGLVKITSYLDEETIIINIEDNGTGIEPEKLQEIIEELKNTEDLKKEGSLGLKNVHDRIVLHYGSLFGIKIESIKNKGTKVILKLPLQSE